MPREEAALAREADRRRTFAIISHPDAGKTTLTEKLLLYAGMVDEAGLVRGRRNSRSVKSDWMAMERERGISVTATALSFEFRGRRINLIDTPGHQDFSEDTYRVLNAADAAVMVLDASKGIEPQTEKLFRVCADRRTPILTFVNKMDRPGADPLGCLGQIEEVLGIDAAPVNWPIGPGPGRNFRGVLDLTTDSVQVYKPVPHGATAVPTESASRSAARGTLLSEEEADHLDDEAELIRTAGHPFDRERFLDGAQTPVYFGSALTNFGIEPFLDGFLGLAPPPGPRPAVDGAVPPERPGFSGVVFKMQANLDPRHRDRVAFVRVCSGRFERDMEATVARTGEKFRVARSVRLFGQERETVEDAFPGDVIGIVTSAGLRLGDTLCEGDPVRFTGRWSFPPERFAVVRCDDTNRRKQFVKGLQQLGEEGVVQLLIDPAKSSLEPILAAVGELQFDVVKFRLETEYGTKAVVSPLPYSSACWMTGPAAALARPMLRSDVRLVRDRDGSPVLLSTTDWALRMVREQNPDLTFDPHPPSGDA
ncbi:peptide chain release factor 3 [Alienimonas californiensis]|uniref:Peptide chain release factor 3 n=1 Tax=Alienimonas californiensis TaxID=2527989 RepID=A0A517PDZ8_9PLAN|nr:peptide chain release factor 3 [Alienimonas californiensis]QDT17605.1 Peptide chain release factor 3 [Alienimonas californiensis]